MMQEEQANTGAGAIRIVPCDMCSGQGFRPLFEKRSGRGETFQVVRCNDCGLVQVNPQPDREAVKPYYEASYFTRRTDRGYNDYFSSDLKRQINLVYEMNLQDLAFFDYEKSLNVKTASEQAGDPPRALDVGCAAGYFVEYLAARGWNARGIELSAAAARFGIEELKLDIITDDFLSCAALAPGSFDLITLWASLEHMHAPSRVLARAHDLLKPGGRMILSTCRHGLLARLRGADWRYMNVPEHLYFFSLSGLKKLARRLGFHVEKSVTYGSGFTTRADAGPFYRLAKRLADPLVKLLDQGDMMALHLRKS